MRDRGQEYYDLTVLHPDRGANWISVRYSINLGDLLATLGAFCRAKNIPMIGLDDPKPNSPAPVKVPKSAKTVTKTKMSEAITAHHRDVEAAHNQIASLHFFLKREGLFDKYMKQQEELRKQKAIYG